MSDNGQTLQSLLDRVIRMLIIDEVAGEVFLVSGKIEQAVAAQIEDDALLSGLVASHLGHRGDRVRCLWRRDDSFGPREQDRGLEHARLRLGPRLNQPFVNQGRSRGVSSRGSAGRPREFPAG